ncbi:FAD-dependent oxidoreductase domain-containing protein 1 [Brachionichthys hirsutus]|uniref:FAD-dependent oxidoreductase domain-containing protein 1 n=1 Tax=Brachionichthys hirsutus TaxID=412623 RepID=UPI00360521F2
MSWRLPPGFRKLRPAAQRPPRPLDGPLHGPLVPGRSLRTSSCVRSDFLKDVENRLAAARRKAAAALPGSGWSPLEVNPRLPPERADVVIVGGGVVGWSVAYWLKRKEKGGAALKVVVVERDPTYRQCSTVLSVGGVRQQFSLLENVYLSMVSADFMRNINEYLDVLDEDPVDVQFNQLGYLFLAGERGAQIMTENHEVQRSAGAKVSLLSPARLKETFPWLNTEGVALASYGLENEGWLDPWSLLNAFRRKALSMGVVQCHGEVTGFKHTTNVMKRTEGEHVAVKRIKSVKVQMPNGLEYQPVESAVVVNAAGAFSGRLARMVAGLSSVVPVEPRKRYVFVFHCPDGPGLGTPLLIDPSGFYFRREGLEGNYIAGMSPTEEEEPDVSNLEVDHQFFEDRIWPLLASRVPAFESLKVTGAWAGYYDYNTFDQNAIIGLHPYISNMYVATGFSGHGLQQAPAAGRAVAELILDGDFRSLDLSRFDFGRILNNEPMLERNIV